MSMGDVVLSSSCAFAVVLPLSLSRLSAAVLRSLVFATSPQTSLISLFLSPIFRFCGFSHEFKSGKAFLPKEMLATVSVSVLPAKL